MMNQQQRDINHPDINEAAQSLKYIGPYLQNRLNAFFGQLPQYPDNVMVTLVMIRDLLHAGYGQYPNIQLQARNTNYFQQWLSNERQSTCTGSSKYIPVNRREDALDLIGGMRYRYCVRLNNHYAWYALTMYMTMDGDVPAAILPDPNKPRYTRCEQSQPWPYCRQAAAAFVLDV